MRHNGSEIAVFIPHKKVQVNLDGIVINPPHPQKVNNTALIRNEQSKSHAFTACEKLFRPLVAENNRIPLWLHLHNTQQRLNPLCYGKQLVIKKSNNPA